MGSAEDEKEQSNNPPDRPDHDSRFVRNTREPF
jgi:hypothetical protein